MPQGKCWNRVKSKSSEKSALGHFEDEPNNQGTTSVAFNIVTAIHH